MTHNMYLKFSVSIYIYIYILYIIYIYIIYIYMVFLVLSIKITSPDRNDRDRSRDVRRSHSPVKLDPLGASGLWRAMVTMFCCLWGAVCVLALRQEEERGEKF
jgi:hypothetical protein